MFYFLEKTKSIECHYRSMQLHGSGSAQLYVKNMCWINHCVQCTICIAEAIVPEMAWPKPFVSGLECKLFLHSELQNVCSTNRIWVLKFASIILAPKLLPCNRAFKVYTCMYTITPGSPLRRLSTDTLCIIATHIAPQKKIFKTI